MRATDPKNINMIVSATKVKRLNSFLRSLFSFMHSFNYARSFPMQTVKIPAFVQALEFVLPKSLVYGDRNAVGKV